MNVQLKIEVIFVLRAEEGRAFGCPRWPSAEASETSNSIVRRLASFGRTACCGELSIREILKMVH